MSFKTLQPKWSLFAHQALNLLLLLSATSPAIAGTTNDDGMLLLSFKYSVLSDPLWVLAGWDYGDPSPCSWNGVTCLPFPPAPASVSGAAARDGGAGNWAPATEMRVVGLELPSSKLVGSIPPELGFIEHLRHLDLSGNSLNGTLPPTIFNATELRILSLAGNNLSGELPDFAGAAAAAGLQSLDLSGNAMFGAVPSNLSLLLPNITVLNLSGNFLAGGLPGGDLGGIQVLDLSSNLFNTSLPAGIDGGSLRYLNLSSNLLTGDIPAGFGMTIPANATVDLSFNNLTGEIPSYSLFLSQKPAAFAGNPCLCGVPLAIPCPIASSLSEQPPGGNASSPAMSPPALAVIPENNTDATQIHSGGGTAVRRDSPATGGLRPAVIAAITAGDVTVVGVLLVVLLYVYQVSKKKQSEHKQQQQQGRREAELMKTVAAPAPVKEQALDFSAASNRTTWFLPFDCVKKSDSGEIRGESTESTSSSPESGDEEEEDDEGAANCAAALPESRLLEAAATLVMVDGETEMERETLLKASATIVGASSSTIVYKAVLADGRVFAVRRIGENSDVGKIRDFESQVRSIAKLRHPNLLRLRGFYWGADEKLLISDYAPNGNLAAVTSSNRKVGSSSFCFSWGARLRIARGVAKGLAFLHERKITHGGLKPSNILLSSDMEPLVADFGLDRLIAGRSSGGGSARQFGSKRSTMWQGSLAELAAASPIAVAASGSPHDSSAAAVLPYQAPEAMKNLKPSTKWDVYSFGVVLLELVAGRLFSEAELWEWNAGGGFVAAGEKGLVVRMVDPSLRGEVQGKEEALLACFKLGFACASMAAPRRPSMKEAVQILERLPSSSSAAAASSSFSTV